MVRFYDVHFHAWNLSHPNILAFLRRLGTRQQILSTLFTEEKHILKTFVAACLFKFGEEKNYITNLLTLMDNDIGSFFIILEFCLKNKEFCDKKNKPNFNKIMESINEKDNNIIYDKIVLTPLIMDFGSREIIKEESGYKKQLWGENFYNILPFKPVEEQVIDLLNGIKRYCDYEMYQEKEKYVLEKRSSVGLFEIYPFLGINTRNYLDDREQKGEEKIKEMLDRYFGDYKGDRKSLFENMGKFDGKIKSNNPPYFAGIKVYPPLGFDPWPDKEPEELKKVKKLYQYCCDKEIPITTHCGKFTYRSVLSETDANKLSAPKKWAEVLHDFSTLKLNFGHFGQLLKVSMLKKFRDSIKRFIKREDKEDWELDIIELMKYPNVYTDFSFQGVYGDYYEHLQKLINGHPELEDRVLFGSDFVINLISIPSYNEYLKYFTTTPYLNSDQKRLFCNTNPEKFLFKNPGN